MNEADSDHIYWTLDEYGVSTFISVVCITWNFQFIGVFV